MPHSLIHKLNAYYKLHAPIYNLTRWAFLGGRAKLIERLIKLGSKKNAAFQVLEIGTGTGFLTGKLAQKQPNYSCYGIDISESMLQIARDNYEELNNVHFIYGDILEHSFHTKYDLIFASYSLSMMKPILEDVLNKVNSLLTSNGEFWIVDFYSTSSNFFKNWMRMNHVEFLEYSIQEFDPHFVQLGSETTKMYLGLWDYRILRFKKK